MGLRPSSNTDILNLTALRRLIYSYCISPVRCIDILDSSLRLGLGISEFHICSRGTNTYARTIILNVIKVNMVLTSRVLVIARFYRYLVVSVRLACCFIPANIVLAILIRPSRNLMMTSKVPVSLLLLTTEMIPVGLSCLTVTTVSVTK